MRSRLSSDMVRMTLTSGGSDNRVVNAGVSPYIAIPSSMDGKTLSMKFWEGSSWEIGEYVYTHGTLTLARARLISSSTGSAVSFTAAALVTEVWTSRDAELLYPPDGYFYPRDYFSTAAQLAGTSDATTEFQALIDAMKALAQSDGGGEYVCDLTQAKILLSGSLTDTGNTNCQIRLPWLHGYADAPADKHAEFAFINRRRKNTDYATATAATPTLPATTGGRITSTITGTGTLPSVLACRADSGAGPFSRAGFHFEDIEIVTAGYAEASTSPTSKMTALNMAYAATMIGRNVFVIGGPIAGSWYAAIPTGPCYGIRWPTNNNNVQIYSQNCLAIGFETGHLVAEHHKGDLQSSYCKWSIEVPAMNHPFMLNKLEAQFCPYGIRATGGDSRGAIFVIAEEISKSGTPYSVFNIVYDVDDSSNYLHGDAQRISKVQGAVGYVTDAVVKNGGTNFTTTRLP
jgi:hypothetical protein